MGISRWKLVLIILLTAAAVTLAALQAGEGGGTRRAPSPEEVGRVVERVLTTYAREVAGGRVWKVRVAGSSSARLEHRVTIPKEFDTIELNHELSRRLAPLGAHVVATERSKEATVTMHIVAAGATVYSLSLLTDPDFHTKENSH